MANNKLQLITSAVFALLMLSLPTKSIAREWIPKQPSEVILKYDVTTITAENNLDGSISTPLNKDASTFLNTASELIERSKTPGNSNKLAAAKKLISQVAIEKLTPQEVNQYYLIQSNVAQSEHNFERSIMLLEKIDKNSIYYSQSLLVAARIYIIQNKLDEADKKCRNLISQNMAASELCLIEVIVHQGRIASARNELERLSKRYASNNTPLARFYHQVKGTMYRVNQDYSKAQKSFSFKLNSAPVSQWYQWADMAFENQANKVVYKKLQRLAEETQANLEDGILVRLARAEKMATNHYDYQNLAQKKVQLRVMRNDQLHAADIAYFYTFVSPDAKLAKRWAKLNWGNVKEPADKALLEQAQKFDN